MREQLRENKHYSMANQSKTTQDREEIRQWAEERGGKPSHVKSTESSDDVGILRIDFPGYSGGDSLETISWDEFFEKFDEQKLALVYQEETAEGERSNFNKIVKAESASGSGDGGSSSSSASGSASRKKSTKKAAKSSTAKKAASKKAAAKKSAPAKKASSKKVAAKKAGVKKAVKKSAAQKTVAKKTASAKKTAAKKMPAKKSTKKATSKKRR